VGKSIDDLCKEEKAKVLGGDSWRILAECIIRRWNARTASRVSEDLAGL
jgi:hypothetical protein